MSPAMQDLTTLSVTHLTQWSVSPFQLFPSWHPLGWNTFDAWSSRSTALLRLLPLLPASLGNWCPQDPKTGNRQPLQCEECNTSDLPLGDNWNGNFWPADTKAHCPSHCVLLNQVILGSHNLPQDIGRATQSFVLRRKCRLGPILNDRAQLFKVLESSSWKC